MWDHLTGRLKLDLPYQAQEQFMLHDSAVRRARCAAAGSNLWLLGAALTGWVLPSITNWLHPLAWPTLHPTHPFRTLRCWLPPSLVTLSCWPPATRMGASRWEGRDLQGAGMGVGWLAALQPGEEGGQIQGSSWRRDSGRRSTRGPAKGRLSPAFHMPVRAADQWRPSLPLPPTCRCGACAPGSACAALTRRTARA